MSTIVATVKGVRLYNTESSSTVYITLDKEVDGYKADDNNVFQKCKTKVISFFRRALTAQLCEMNDDIALYRSCLTRGLTQSEFAKILFNAKLKLNFTEHSAGEVIKTGDTERTLERDSMFVDVVSIELHEKGAARLQQLIDDAD